MVASEAWQREAYGFYNVIGEVAYVISKTADTVAMCDIVPIVDDESIAPGGWRETPDDRVLRVWKAFTGARGDKKELYRKAAMHYQIGGESFLVGSNIKDRHGLEGGVLWQFLSPLEITVEGGGRSVKRTYNYAGMQPVELKDTYVARLWRSAPDFEQQPDSALKHSLPIMNELVLLSQVVDAIAKTRLPAGILFVPDEMSFGSYDETEDDSDETDDIDPLTQELTEQLTAVVENRASAASLVPLIMRGPAEFADKIKLIDVARDLDKAFIDLRIHLLSRLATSLDIPPEMMTGVGGLNHWSSFNIDSNFVNRHVKPIGESLAEFLTTAYLRPMLIQFEGMTDEEAATFSLHFDPAKVVARADTGPNARLAFDRGEIKAVAFLRENGLDEADAPDREERKIHDLRALMQAEPIIYGAQVMGMLYPELKDKLEVPGVTDVPGARPGDGDPGNPTGMPERKNHTGPNSDPVVDNESGQGLPKPRGPAHSRTDEASLVEKLARVADSGLMDAVRIASAEQSQEDAIMAINLQMSAIQQDLAEEAARHLESQEGLLPDQSIPVSVAMADDLCGLLVRDIQLGRKGVVSLENLEFMGTVERHLAAL